jgi:putative tryptophan/tyrosine transport system substrate-binding protein
MRRREFITLLSSVPPAWPLVAYAQQSQQMRHIGILMNRAASDPEGQARVVAFKQGMQQLGWSEGRNIELDPRWGEDDINVEQKYAAELIALAPDLIFASGTLSVAALQRLSPTVPIVFVGVTDPLGAGFVDSLARPGGNATGFMIYEYSLSGKWMARTAQGNCTWRDAGRYSKESRQSCRSRFIRRHPSRSEVAQDRGDPNRQSPRRPRD